MDRDKSAKMEWFSFCNRLTSYLKDGSPELLHDVSSLQYNTITVSYSNIMPDEYENPHLSLNKIIAVNNAHKAKFSTPNK